MERRHFLKLAFGFIAGASALVAGAAGTEAAAAAAGTAGGAGACPPAGRARRTCDRNPGRCRPPCAGPGAVAPPLGLSAPPLGAGAVARHWGLASPSLGLAPPAIGAGAAAGTAAGYWRRRRYYW